VEDGTYQFRALAATGDGAVKWSSFSVNFTVDNPDPPQVYMRDPQPGDVLSGVVRLRAQVSDSDSGLQKDGVQYYFSQDGSEWYLIGARATPQPGSTDYVLEWDTTELPDGPYWLQARVTDETLLSAVSESVNVTVQNDVGGGVKRTGESQGEYGGLSLMDLLLIMIIIIIVMGIIVVLVLTRHAKQRQAKLLRAELVAEQGPDVSYVHTEPGGPTLGTAPADESQMLAAPGAEAGAGGTDPSLLLPSQGTGGGPDTAGPDAAGAGVTDFGGAAGAAPDATVSPEPAGEDNPFMVGEGEAEDLGPEIVEYDAGDMAPPPVIPEEAGAAGERPAAKKPAAKPKPKPRPKPKAGGMRAKRPRPSAPKKEDDGLGTLPGE
jgi:hypothetical protein